jgi:hypothetical protein
MQKCMLSNLLLFDLCWCFTGVDLFLRIVGLCNTPS